MTPRQNMSAGDRSSQMTLAGKTPINEGLDDRVSPLLSSPARARRSSVAIRPRLSLAIERACSHHGNTLAKAAAREVEALQASASLTSEVQRKVYSSCCQHRMSIIKAAEVLQEAGIGEESDDEHSDNAGISSEVSEKLQLVQKA